MSNETDHVVIVGGSKGLGRVVADNFLARGNRVTILARSPAKEASTDKLQQLELDLENLSTLDKLIEQTLTFGGRLRYLVFCQRYRGKDDAWAGEIQVSLTATKQLIEGFADHFQPEGDRAIAIVSSVYAEFVGGSQPLSYHVAKAGLNQLVKYYAWTMGRKGVRVNALMPLTYLKPESQAHYLAQPDLMALYEKLVPLKRLGTAQDSANLIEFLSSDKAAFINGQAIFIDGGVSVIWPEELAKSLTGFITS